MIFSLSQSVRGLAFSKQCVSTQNIKWGSIFELCLNLEPFSEGSAAQRPFSLLFMMTSCSHIFVACSLVVGPGFHVITWLRISKLPAKTFFGTVKAVHTHFSHFGLPKMIASRKPAGPQCAAKLREPHSNGAVFDGSSD